MKSVSARAFGEALRYLLRELELSQSRLSDMSGVDQSQISRMLVGERGSEDQRRAIAAALDLPYEKMMQIGMAILAMPNGKDVPTEVTVAPTLPSSLNGVLDRLSNMSPAQVAKLMGWLDLEGVPHVAGEPPGGGSSRSPGLKSSRVRKKAQG